MSKNYLVGDVLWEGEAAEDEGQASSDGEAAVMQIHASGNVFPPLVSHQHQEPRCFMDVQHRSAGGQKLS